MRNALALLFFVAPVALAATPADLLDTYAAQARGTDPAFAGFSGERGADLYRGNVATPGGRGSSCSSCHSPDPRRPGRHARTGKEIAPLAPTAAPGRLTDLAKAEKWFGRNCRDVLRRECTAREKGDFVRFLIDSK